MSRSFPEALVPHTSWQPRRGGAARRRFRRYARRTLCSLLLLALIGLLLYLVFSPFWHPRAVFVALTGSDYGKDVEFHVLRTRPLDYVTEDLAALERLRGRSPVQNSDLSQNQTFHLRAPSDLTAIADQLDAQTANGSDVLIFYVSAHGVSDAGVPYLLWTFDPTLAPLGRLELADLLGMLSGRRAAAKLLILDAGCVQSDARQGMVVNEFPRLLAQQVHDLADRNLWVLCSYSLLERSHASRSMQRSVFGDFVAHGLDGAADLDEDRAVSLDELSRYVAANVAAWVQDSTGGAATQTPRLLWGGGSDLSGVAAFPVLLSARKVAKASAESIPSKTADRSTQQTWTTAAAREARYHSPVLRSSPGHMDTRVLSGRPPDLRPNVIVPNTSVDAGRVLPRATARPRRDVLAMDSDSSRQTSTAETTPPDHGGKDGSLPSGEPGEAAAPKADGATPAADAKPSDPNAGSTAPAAATTDTTRQTQGESPPQPAAPTMGGDTPPAAEEPDRVPALLAEAWGLRDRLESRDSGTASPVDFAPHLWREFQEQLLGYERLYRAGAVGDKVLIARALRQMMVPLRKLAEGWQGPSLPQGPGIVERIAELLPRQTAPLDRPRTLGLLEQLARQQHQPVSAERHVLTDAVDRAMTSSTRQEFDEWLAKLPAHDLQFSEVRLAQQFAQIRGLNWAVLQQALQARRYGERVAALDPCAVPWVQQRVERADQIRLEAERRLLDQIDADRESFASERLRKALSEYGTAAEKAALIRQAIHLKNDLVNRAPYYLQWYEAAGAHSGGYSPDYDDLKAMLKGLCRLCSELETENASQWESVENLQTRLLELQRRIEVHLQYPAIATLTEPPVVPGDGWRIELLLSTPLPRTPVRLQLLQAAVETDAASAAGFRPAEVPKAFPQVRATTPEDWQRLRDLAELKLLLARIAVSDASENQGPVNAIQTAFKDVSSITERLPSDRMDAEFELSESQLCLAYQQMGKRLRDFYRHLPASVEREIQSARIAGEASSTRRRRQMLRSAERSLRMVDARDAAQTFDMDAVRLVNAAELSELIAWHRRRFVLAQADAPADELQYLRESVRLYAVDASAPSNEGGFRSDNGSALALSAATSLSLATVPEREFEVVLHNRRAQPSRVWIVLDYDPEVVDVVDPADFDTYRTFRLRSQLQRTAATARVEIERIERSKRLTVQPQRESTGAPADLGGMSPMQESVEAVHAAEYPERPDLASLTPTLILPPSAVVRLGFRVRARDTLSLPTYLLVKAIGNESYVRHQSEIVLPFPDVLELQVTGTPNSWTQSDERIVLHPFPNRTTEYQFRLKNRGEQPRTVGIELLVLKRSVSIPVPRTALSASDAADLLQRFLPATRVATIPEMSLPAGESLLLPFPLPPEGPGPSKTGEETTDDAGKNGGAGSASAGQPPPPVPYGMLLVVTDIGTERKTIKRIDLVPQRPRRFLRADVGYSLDRERIEVRITPQNRELIPPGGVSVRCEFDPPLADGTAAKLDGTIKAPDYETTLFAEVPEDRHRVVTVRLSVDGYPRAFVYHVPCDVSSRNLPEVAGLLEARIVSPQEGTAFPVPSGSIPVELQIDAPPGSLENGGDYVWVGIDADRDRVLDGESPVHLSSDRQVAVALEQLAPQGMVRIQTEVTDFRIEIPDPGLRNTRVGILAEVRCGKKHAWSLPVEIVLDGTPPELSNIQLQPGPVVVTGSEIQVSVEASDRDLSGLDKVEAAFDLAGLGEFAPAPPPQVASQEPGGRWMAKLATAALTPGTHTLLLRATDKVGNSSGYSRVSVRVVTPEQADAMQAQLTNRVSGTVLYGGQPVPNAQLTLESEKGPEVAPTVTDDNGNFAFLEVPAGTFQLTAKKLLRNKVRQIAVPVVVEPPPDRVKRIVIELP